MTAPQNPRVTQVDEEWAEEVASAANIVTNGGYYEIDIDAVTLVIARHREAAEAASKAREAALVEAFQKVADHLREEADKDKYGPYWRPLYYSAEQIERALLAKEPDA